MTENEWVLAVLGGIAVLMFVTGFLIVMSS